ncbi:hypothetical protein VSS37_02220 [Candidatus Thiothrix sp. Deng01]|uniref:Uncharacterized protein n=1 Tax=Candidatus Thiothrix phosphatis TaxID=3112415 RepID=A0ABU6CSH5_9GAMM|nr:hypothetical protein [Candidatus Thiothrix sp. Deng01]MEB4589786.1 hypothetical protein [Candidatus Thiothrix sp. Deng01]
MGTVNDLLEAARKLTHEERAQLIQKLEELEADDWDAQIAADAASGKLDFLLAEALDAETKGQLRDF